MNLYFGTWSSFVLASSVLDSWRHLPVDLPWLSSLLTATGAICWPCWWPLVEGLTPMATPHLDIGFLVLRFHAYCLIMDHIYMAFICICRVHLDVISFEVIKCHYISHSHPTRHVTELFSSVINIWVLYHSRSFLLSSSAGEFQTIGRRSWSSAIHFNFLFIWFE
jgi:hypothetical protein